MQFEHAYHEFLAFHSSRRRGERLRRLRQGHGHAERLFLQVVWWPAFGSFRSLHPEYETINFDGRQRYLDFAYIDEDLRLAIEIDGYGPHVARISRWQFIDQLRRQNHLVLDGWSLLRFAYDEVNEEPRHCQQTLQQFMGRRLSQGASHRQSSSFQTLSRAEKTLVDLALQAQAPLTPLQVAAQLDVSRYTAVKLLRSLMAKSWFEAASGSQRIRSYRLKPGRLLQ